MIGYRDHYVAIKKKNSITAYHTMRQSWTGKHPHEMLLIFTQARLNDEQSLMKISPVGQAILKVWNQNQIVIIYS